MKSGSKIIGLAVGHRNLLLAEVGPKGGRNAVLHFAEFSFPEGLSLSTPEKLGEALGQFIKNRKFTTKDVVIGLPAKRLLTRRKEVPPASPAVAASMLRLQAEGDFSSELDNLVMDFAGTPSTVEATNVLLIATNRDVVTQCETMAKSAGLRVQGVTATSAALGRATSRLPGGDGLVLNLGQAGAEIVMQHGQDPTHLRHLNVTENSTPESIGALAGEIRRMMASIPTNGTPMKLALWKGNSNNETMGNLLEQRLSMPVTTPDVGSLVLSDDPEAEAFAPAIAVALAALEPAGLPLDFIHSRLTPPTDTSHRLPIILWSAAALLVLGIIIAAVMDLNSLYTKRTAIESKIKGLDSQFKQAQIEEARLKAANDWIPQGPHFVACFRDVTNLFPRQGGTIWASSLSTAKDSAKDSTLWILSGKATSDREAQRLFDNMLADTVHFAKPSPSITVDPSTRLVSFKIQFYYLGD